MKSGLKKEEAEELMSKLTAGEHLHFAEMRHLLNTPMPAS